MSRPSLRDISSTEELYLTGLHLAQYRHATRRAEEYWREGSGGDPETSGATPRWAGGTFNAASSRSPSATSAWPLRRSHDSTRTLTTASRCMVSACRCVTPIASTRPTKSWPERPGPERGGARPDFARAQLAAQRGDLETAVTLLNGVIDGNHDQLSAA